VSVSAHSEERSSTQLTATVIGRRSELVPLVLLVVLNLADVVSTRYGLAHGAVEANPLSRLMLRGAQVELVKLALLGLLGLRIAQRRPTFALTVACWTAAGAYGMAVFSNAIVLTSLH